jgi:hypothetical protein
MLLKRIGGWARAWSCVECTLGREIGSVQNYVDIGPGHILSAGYVGERDNGHRYTGHGHDYRTNGVN